jgi:hypothetical protein
MRRAVVGMLVLVAACAESKSDMSTPARAPDRKSEVDARAELAQAQSDLDLALGGASGTGAPQSAGATQEGNCAAACRALASLERAADHLCALSSASECADARSRVETARDRVAKACGACH